MPLKLKEIWAIRIRLQIQSNPRNLTLFNLGIDSKLRGCDLLKLRANDICHGSEVLKRATILQQKTKRPVQFEITQNTRESVTSWIKHNNLYLNDYLFPSRVNPSSHMSTRQYSRIVDQWIALIGLNHSDYGARSIRRTKASLIYKRTKNHRAIQLHLGHTKLESTVKYLGIEVDDAIEMAELTEA